MSSSMVSSASAIEAPLSVVGQDQLACPSVSQNSSHDVTGGCQIHLGGEMRLFLHIFGIESTEATCLIELEGRIQGDGGGYVTTATSNAHPLDTQCNESTWSECAEGLAPAHEFPWRFATEENSSGVVGAHFDVCYDMLEWGICPGELRINLTEEQNNPSAGLETQHIAATDERLGSSAICEFTIDLETEADASHELMHILHP